MIEVTEEMLAAFVAQREDWCDEIGCGRDDCLTERLAAVLAIVERDHLRADASPDRCSDCGRTARELLPWSERINGKPVVVARLGPGCYKRRLAAAMTRTALPIGGEP